MLFRITVLCVASFPLLATAGEPSGPPKHLDEAVKLLKSLDPDQTSYRHKDTVVRWSSDAQASECHTDCSGFLNALIVHTYPQYTAESLHKWLGKARPTADTYFDAIRAKKGFAPITGIAEICPGDIIAIKYPPKSPDTGHTMLIAARPKPRKATAPFVADTEQWEVAVIDSTSRGHGKTDSRRRDDGSFRTGLGTGNLRLYTMSGSIVGYSWSSQPGSEYHDDKAKALVIGRLDPKYRPDMNE
jgi:hypothetical protein